MKLAGSFKIISAPQRDVHARALRAIGQDLASLFPETLEIHLDRETYVVCGQCPRNRFEASQTTAQANTLKGRWLEILSHDLTERKPQELPATVRFRRIYPPEEISRIDELGIRRRFSAGKLPDIRSLGEILRTIGRLIDGQKGKLVRLVKDSRQISFEFIAPDDTAKTETTSIMALYKLQRQFYEKRGGATGLDPWGNRKL